MQLSCNDEAALINSSEISTEKGGIQVCGPIVETIPMAQYIHLFPVIM